MEEILASIRKIISDEAATSPVNTKPVSMKVMAPEPAEPPSEPQGQDEIDALLAGFDAAEAAGAPHTAASDVLELTEAMAAPEMAAPAEDDIAFVEPEPPKPAATARPAPVAPPPRAAEPPAVTQPRPMLPLEERLISEATDSAISSAFGRLTHTILSQNARTLDDLVQDMLRPMLKSWLDDNLPTLVERLVRAEIERVSRGGR